MKSLGERASTCRNITLDQIQIYNPDQIRIKLYQSIGIGTLYMYIKYERDRSSILGDMIF